MTPLVPLDNTRQACEPCRRKKTKCPGERPVCAFCRRLGQQCVYLPKIDPRRALKSERNRIRPRSISRTSPQPSRGGVQQEIASDATTVSHGHGEASSQQSRTDLYEGLSEQVEIYRSRIHFRPIPLYSVEALKSRISRFPTPLLHSFRAATLLYTCSATDGSAGLDMVANHVELARSELMPILLEGNLSIAALEALCLLVLIDCITGRIARASATLGMGMSLTKLHRPGRHIKSIQYERLRRCQWSMHILERTFTVPSSAFMLDAAPNFHFLIPTTSLPEGPNGERRPPQPASEVDLGIEVYCLHLVDIFGEITSYVRKMRQESGEDYWQPTSRYHQLMNRVYQFEDKFAQLHRFESMDIRQYSLQSINEHQAYWSPWLLLQLLFHTSLATLQHPILHIPNLAFKARTRAPPTFLQQAIDQSRVHSEWSVYFLRTCLDMNLPVDDPLTFRLAVMSATIPFIFQFTKDVQVSNKAQNDFELCCLFTERLAAKWPKLGGDALRALEHLRNISAQQIRSDRDSGLPPVNLRAIWDLLDPESHGSFNSESSTPTIGNGQPVQTSYLSTIPAMTESPLVISDDCDDVDMSTGNLAIPSDMDAVSCGLDFTNLDLSRHTFLDVLDFRGAL